jgi:hypothetical protein
MKTEDKGNTAPVEQTNATEAAAPETPATPALTLENETLAKAVSDMIAGTVAQQAGTDAANAAGLAAKAGGWDAIRTPFVTVLLDDSLGVVGAELVLTGYKKRAMGEVYEKTANQYASDLRRMVKAVKDEFTLPVNLTTCGRSAYLEHKFWETAAPKNTGSTAAKKAAKKLQGEAAAKAVAGDKLTAVEKKALEASGTVGAAIARVATDEGLRDVMTLLAGLHGDFRAQALGECKKLLLSISERQAQAGTGTK